MYIFATFIAGVVLSNAGMWYTYTKALAGTPNSAQVQVLNQAANLIFTVRFTGNLWSRKLLVFGWEIVLGSR